MTDNAAAGNLHVPARDIPVPAHVSEVARTILGMGRMESPPYPPLDDAQAWRDFVAAQDSAILPMLAEQVKRVGVHVEEAGVSDVTVYVITPETASTDDRRIYLDIHGGGLITGGGEVCRAMGTMAAARTGLRTWSVDYRMPPDHPYPAPLDDCLSAYRSLLEKTRPEDIIVGGGSAGANLAAALILRARDEGLPLPAGVVLQTPEVDLTESGDSFSTNMGVDTLITRSLLPASLLYAGEHDLKHPYLSPLFGDFAKGFPPTLLTSGTRDLFLSNTVRMHRALRAAGVPAELHILEAAPHGGFWASAPEDAELDQEVRRFIDTRRLP